jgi:hypothetical protein
MSFADICNEDPDKAKALFLDKSRGMGRSEGAEFMASVEKTPLLSGSKDQIKEGLVAAGKFDDTGFWGHMAEGGKTLVKVLVQTAEASVPYFQAYLKAKEQADKTMNELIAETAKLAAAAKKLSAIELSIDAFGGRGA